MSRQVNRKPIRTVLVAAAGLALATGAAWAGPWGTYRSTGGSSPGVSPNRAAPSATPGSYRSPNRSVYPDVPGAPTPPDVDLPDSDFVIVYPYPYLYFGYRSYGRGYYDYDDEYYYDDDPSVDAAALLRLARAVDPQLVNPNAAPATTPKRPSRLESAQRAMLRGDFDSAISVYAELADRQRRDDLENARPTELNDRSAQRLLALAYAAKGEFDLASENFREAYEEDPSLARKPLRGAQYFDDDGDLRTLVQRAVAHANRSRTSDSWYLVGMLMQAEGRYQRANQMMERAEALKNAPVPTEDTPEHTDLPDKPELATEPGLLTDYFAAG